MGYFSNIASALLGQRGEVSTGSKEYGELFARPGVTTVTADNAMQVATVFACVRLLSETVATLPLNLMQNYKGKKRHAVEHPLYSLLKNKPNADMNTVQLKEALVASMCLRGNGYLQKVTTRGGVIAEIPFLDAARMSMVRKADGSIVYYYISLTGKSYTFNADELVNIPYFSLNGIEGITPIKMCRDGISLAMTAQNHAKMFYENGGKPNLAIELPQTLSEDAYKRLKTSFNNAYSGQNSYKTAILEGGATAKTLTMTAKDAEFIATRKFQKSEIAAMFNIPPHLVGDLEKATFSNIEQQSIEFEKFTIRPLVTKIEAALNASMLSDKERLEGYYFRFNTEALLRGDTKTRYDAYAIARQWGWMSANDIRQIEDLNPIDGGDIYLSPLNMVDTSNPQPQGGANNA